MKRLHTKKEKMNSIKNIKCNYGLHSLCISVYIIKVEKRL